MQRESADNGEVNHQPPTPPVFQSPRPSMPVHREAKTSQDHLALVLALAAPVVTFFLSFAFGFVAVILYLGATAVSWYLVEESRAWTPGEKRAMKVALAAVPALVLAMFLIFTLVPEDTLGNGLGPGVIFYMLIMAALANLLVQVVRLWVVGPRQI